MALFTSVILEVPFGLFTDFMGSSTDACGYEKDFFPVLY